MLSACHLPLETLVSKAKIPGESINWSQARQTLDHLPTARQFPCQKGQLVTGQTTGAKAVFQD